MTYQKKTISIKHILFDHQNPRHDPSQGQQEALQKLLNDEDIRQLAQDIVGHGVNPSENLIVIPSPETEGKYIVLEGNRRLSALKVLQKPTLCKSNKDEKYFSTLAKKYKHGFYLDCTVVHSKKDADHWILIKHGTDQGGAAPKRWNATQSTRFAQSTDSKSTNDRAYQLLKYALDNGIITKKEHESIKITTITRYLSTPNFRQSIGIEFKKNGEIVTDISIDKFNEVIRRFLTDDITGKLSSRSNASDRKHYGEVLLRDLNIPGSRQKETIPLPAKPTKQDDKFNQNPPSIPPKIKDNPSPNKRQKVIPSSFSLKIHDPKTKRIYDELKQINAQDFPNAAALLFRTFLELSIHLYLNRVMNKNEQQRDLHKHILAVADDLKAKGIHKKKLASLRSIPSTPTQSSPLSISLLNNYVHGTVEPNAKDLILAWDPIQESIALIFNEINKINAGQNA